MTFYHYMGCPECGATIKQTERFDYCSCGYQEYYPDAYADNPRDHQRQKRGDPKAAPE